MGKKILLVDDSDVVAGIVTDTLSEAGFDVIRAVNGIEGIIMAYNEIPDLIITDVEMPLLKGYQSSRLLKSKRGVKDIPIIMHTSLSEDKDQFWGISAGADEYVVKDFNDLDVLIEKSKKLCDHPPYQIDIIKEDAPKINQNSIFEMLSNLLDNQLFQSSILNRLADIGRNIESLSDTVNKIMELLNKVCEHHIIVMILKNDKNFIPYILPSADLFENDVEDFYKICLGDFYNFFDKNTFSEEKKIIFGIENRQNYNKIRLDQNRISSYTCLELKGKGNLNIGTFNVGHLKNNYFSETILSNLTVFTTGGGIILENSLLFQQISTMEQNIRSVFSKFVPADIIDDLVKRKTTSTLLMGEKRNVAILFSDIREFTNISENNKPEDVVSFLNIYLEIMCEIIIYNGGTIDKFIGDAILAVFGAPRSFEDNDYRAVKSAAEMIQSIKKVTLPQIKLPPDGFNIGIGIHGGNAIIGNIGSRDKFEYTVIGDTVNLASRLEGLTKHYKQKIIISDTVREKIKDKVFTREIDTVKVKGKDLSTTIYSVKTEDEPSFNEDNLKEYYKGLSMYKIKNWKTAIEYFNETLVKIPDDSISKIYIERCKEYIKNPPTEDWEGAEVLDFK